MPEISVIVPVYNAEDHIEECIRSILAQTFSNIEILLINDGSTDASGAVCEMYAQTDLRIKLISTTNQGVAAARNLGMEHAAGKWLCFVDSDDYLPADALEKLLLSAGDADIVIGDYFTDVHGQISPRRIRNGKEAVTEPPLYRRIGYILECYNCRGAKDIFNLASPWGKLYKRDFCRKNCLTFPFIKRSQDVIFNISANRLTEHITFTDSKVYCYRLHAASVCHRYTPDFEDTANCFLTYLRTALCPDADPSFYDFYTCKKLQFLIANIELAWAHPSCPVSRREKISGIRDLCRSYDLKNEFAQLDQKLLSSSQRLLLWLLANGNFRTAFSLFEIKKKFMKLFRLDC